MRAKFWIETTLFFFFPCLSLAATEKIIYSFPGGAGGESPNELTIDLQTTGEQPRYSEQIKRPPDRHLGSTMAWTRLLRT